MPAPVSKRPCKRARGCRCRRATSPPAGRRRRHRGVRVSGPKNHPRPREFWPRKIPRANSGTEKPALGRANSAREKCAKFSNRLWGHLSRKNRLDKFRQDFGRVFGPLSFGLSFEVSVCLSGGISGGSSGGISGVLTGQTTLPVGTAGAAATALRFSEMSQRPTAAADMMNAFLAPNPTASRTSNPASVSKRRRAADKASSGWACPYEFACSPCCPRDNFANSNSCRASPQSRCACSKMLTADSPHFSSCRRYRPEKSDQANQRTQQQSRD